MSSYLHVLTNLCEKFRAKMAEKKGEENDKIDWCDEVEILFLYAMAGHKPVGVNRHFMMACIHHKFSNFINRDITSKPIWDHLDTMYDMAALHECEIIPFPNEEKEYELPEDEFGELVRTRLGQTLENDSNQEEKKDKGKKSPFVKPKPVPLLPSQTKENAHKSSSTVTPVVKVNKAQVAVKTKQTNSNISDARHKTKVDPNQNKFGRSKSSSPAPAKGGKLDSGSAQAKTEPGSDSSGQKVKSQGGVSAGKKVQKQEKNDSETRKSKEIPADKKKSSSVKEIVNSSRRNAKGDNTPKKSLPESGKRVSDTSSQKHGKAEKSPMGTPTKSVKFDVSDSDSSTKSSRSQVKNEAAEKKTRRMKEESPSPKKGAPPTKRRRIN